MDFISQLKRPYTRTELDKGFKITLAAQIDTKQEVREARTETAVLEKAKNYIITVKKYMTEPSTPSFDFMSKFNKDTPMPFVTMVGTIEKETKGMYYMKLHAEPMKVTHCMKCGRILTHPVSRLYGLGPECGKHAYINPFQTEEELQQNLDLLTKNLADIKWEGWVIKSAIKEFKEVI